MNAADKLWRNYARNGPVSRSDNNVTSLAAWQAQSAPSAQPITYEDDDAPRDAQALVAQLRAEIAMLRRTLKSAGRMHNGRPVMTIAEAAQEMNVNRSTIARRMQPNSRNRLQGYQAENRQWWVYADQDFAAPKRGRPNNSHTHVAAH